jgi:hypothetical protein
MITWRYLPASKVKHALEGGGGGHGPSALCGTSARTSDYWCGTGSQAEYETVEQLPECRRCARILTPKAER